jgi:phosphoglycolate phosphatase
LTGSSNGRFPALAIIFDLDGTLIDSVPDLTRAVNVALTGIGRPPKQANEIAGYVGNGVRVLLERSFGEGTPEETLGKAQKLFEKHYEAHCLDHTRIYPGVKETLAHLASKPKAVVTNKPEGFTRKILEGLGLAGEFKIVLGGDSTPIRKPRPEPLWEAARRLGARPEDTLVVGDSPIDVKAGKAAGMMTCAVSYGLARREILESEKPDRVIDRFSQLKDIIHL